MLFFILRGESFAIALISALTAAVVVFLSWAVGREIDPAHEWSAFIALPLIYIAFFVAGRPSLLVLFFIILCCRFLDRSCGLQPLKTDSLVILVLSKLLYFNDFYFALPYLIILFLIDALAEPANRFQYISALVSSAAYLILLIALRPELAFIGNQNIPVIYLTAAAAVFLFSAVYVSYITRYAKVINDLNTEELKSTRVNAARLLTAAWLVTEILCSGVIILLQIYPVALIYGGVLVYHLGRLFRQNRPKDQAERPVSQS